MSRESRAIASTSSTGTGLRLYLLGTPIVEWAGHPLGIDRRQVRALLYRLAVAERPVPRAHLAFLFWPDVPEATARRNLTGLLAHLRRGLPESGLLVATRDHIELLAARVWSDVQTYGRAPAAQGHVTSVDDLRETVDLYRGPFLDGFSLPECPEFEEWATLERYTLEQRYLKTLVSLIQDLADSSEYATAIDYAHRYLASDELAEDVHRQLIDLYVRTGDRSAALRQYEHCVLVLERELGVSPLPETQAAYQSALSAQPAPRPPQAVQPAWTTLPSLHLALIGRDETLRKLEDAYQHARKGRGRFFLISGESGIGKSRLMQDFATRLMDQVSLLTGTAFPDTQMIPYGPIVEMLRPVLLARQASSSVPSEDLAAVSTLIPELRLVYPHLEPPAMVGHDQLRIRLFEALSLHFAV